MDYTKGYPVTFNDEMTANSVYKVASNIVGKDQVDFPAEKVMLGEDFGYYTQKIKGCFIHLGCRNEEKGFVNMVHHPQFNLDEDCLVYGAALLTEIIRDINQL
ncbi:MAG: M20/M25/M40 family metallo-hydrolase [Chlamydiales bacterium]